MEQHPIPQQISSYQFKLVGDMTLLQFGKSAIGLILAAMLNTTDLVFFVKYPLMVVCGAGGLASAFVPIEDRPLEVWVMSFIRSIYSPTIYIWKKKSPQNWLDIDSTKRLKEGDEIIKVPKKDESKVKEFIQSLPSFKRESANSTEVATDTNKRGVDDKDLENVANSMDEVTDKKTNPKNGDKTKKKKMENYDKNNETKGRTLKLEKRKKLTATGIAEFGGVPMPATPTEPNVLSGMVIGPNDEIIERAIVEVRDRNDNPVRVFKTNALGQFKTITPLLVGNYLVITEKEGYKFDRVNVSMDGKVLKPIKIRAKRKVNQQTEAKA